MEIVDYKEVQLENTAVALGKFQGLHKGHMLLIDEIVAMSERDGLTATVFTINMPAGDGVLQLAKERFDILREKGVDVAVECDFSADFASMTPERFVKDVLVEKLHVACVVVGEDFKFGLNRLGDVDRLVEFGLKYGFRVVAFPKLTVGGEIVSASLIRTLVSSGRVEEIESYAGRPYTVSGTVVSGKRLGRTIGFPTANLHADERKLLPAKGVYETSLCICGNTYTGITNIGDNPTVEHGNTTHIETYILDFSGDLYGCELTIAFRRRLRDEIRFSAVEELKKQLELDKASVMHQ